MRIKFSKLILLATLTLSAILSVAQTPYYAKNSGEWNDASNWTTDASGLVYSNSGGVVPGISAGTYDVTVNADKEMTITIPKGIDDNDMSDYVVINKLNLKGKLIINRPEGAKRVYIKELVGDGILQINALSILHLLPTDYSATPADNKMFNLSSFKGTVEFKGVSDQNVINPFGNPYLRVPAIAGDATEKAKYENMEMPSCTLLSGNIALGTKYIIDGDLTIESGCTFYIYPGITVEVMGNVINRGTIMSSPVSAGSANSTLKIHGNLDNSQGVMKLFGYSGTTKALNNVITEFVGNKDSEIILNPTNGSSKDVVNTDNVLFRIVCNKEDNAAAKVYARSGVNCLTLGCVAAEGMNTGANYNEMPFIVKKGTLDLGAGICIGGDANGWWDAVAPKSGSSFNTSVLQLNTLGHTKGSVYIREGATLSVSGAEIHMGENNPMFIAGNFVLNSGKFYSGGPGIFYVYPIDEDNDGEIIKTSTPSRMTINGGELHTSRNVALNTSGYTRSTVHFQLGGTLAFDVDPITWSRNANDLTNKTVYLGAGSQFVMHDGKLIVKKDAVGGKESLKISGKDVQILMIDLSDPAHPAALPTLIDGGEIIVGDKDTEETTPEITAMLASCNNVTVAKNAKLTLLPITGGIHVNGNMAIDGTMTPNNDLYIDGNFTVTGTYNSSSNKLTFTGSKDATYNANNVGWGDLVVEKEQNAVADVKSGTTLKVSGDIVANSGSLSGSVTLIGSGTQVISDYTDGHEGLANVDLNINSNTTSPSIATDVVLRNVKFSQSRKFYLGYNNLKIKNYPETTNGWGNSCGFEVPATNTASAHGLTLPVPNSVNGKYLFPMIVGNYYTTVQVLQGAIDYSKGYDVTVVPVARKHPAMKDNGALGCYWIIKNSSNIQNLPQGKTMYSCRNMNTSDLGNDTKRQVFITPNGQYRGVELTSIPKEGQFINFSNNNSPAMPLLSGDFTAANSTDMNDDLLFIPIKSGNWQEYLWKTCEVGSGKPTTLKSYNNGKEFDILYGTATGASDNVYIRKYDSNPIAITIRNGGKGKPSFKKDAYYKYVIVFKGYNYSWDNTKESYSKAGIITIEEDCQLTLVEDNEMSQFHAVGIKGVGTLEYQANDLNENSAIKFLTSDGSNITNHTEFCNSTVSRFIINLKGDRTLDLDGSKAEFPNLEITGTGKLLLTGTNSLTVHGDLTISGSAKLDCGTGRNVFLEKDLNVEAGAEFIVGGESGDKELKIDGNIINNGTISGGGCPVYLWGSVENNGSIDIDGDVYFWGPSGMGTPVTVKSADGKTATNTRLGNAIHINKSADDCTVEFDIPVTAGASGTDRTTVEINTGILDLRNSGATLVQYTKDGSGSDFKIPTTGALNIKSNGTFNFAIKASARVNSVYLAGEMSISGGATVNVKNDDLSTNRGIVYSSNGTLTVDGATLNTHFITPSSDGSALDLSTIGSSTINCSGNDDEMMGFYGVFDIRNGVVEMSGNTKVNIDCLPLESTTTPNIYYAPSNSDVNRDMTITIGGTTLKTDAEEKNIRHFCIEASSPIGTLVVNTKYARLINSDLVVLGNLSINSGMELDANIENVTIGGDLTVNGSYTIEDDQTTTFNGASTATVTASSDLNLGNMVSEASGLQINQNVIAHKSLTINKGNVVIADEKKLQAYGDVLIKSGSDVEAAAGGSENGKLVVGGGGTSTVTSTLFCKGSIDNLVIDNAAGVNSFLQQTSPITIQKSLTLENGVFDIAGNMIDLKGESVIEGTGFGQSKMISTNGSFTDNGIKLYWKLNETKTFTIPLGKKGKVYTPVVLNKVKASKAGELCISTNDEAHPELLAAITNKSSNSGKTALPYYWIFTCNNLQTVDSDDDVYIQFEYPAAYTDYVSACYLTAANEWSIGSTALNTDSPMKIKYLAKGKSKFTGEYTACTSGMDVDPLGLYVSIKNGNWNEMIWGKMSLVRNEVTGALSLGGLEYQKDGSGNDIIYNGNKVPVMYYIPQNAGAIIRSNVTVTTDGINAKYAFISAGATLEFSKGTKNNNMTSIQGTGTLKVNSALSMPSGRYGDFCKIDGGTIEYGGGEYGVDDGYTVFEMPVANNVVFSGTGKRYLRGDIDVKVYGKVTIDGPELVMQGGKKLDIESHIFTTFADGAAYEAGKASAVAGNTLSLTSGKVSGDGYFSMDDFVYTKRYIESGAGSNQQVYSNQYVGHLQHSVAIGDGFTSYIPGMIVNNNQGVAVNKDLSLSNLELINGILFLDDHTLTVASAGTIEGGNDNSYIDGRLAVNPQAGVNAVYPLGDDGHYASTALIPMASGKWIIEYVHKNPKLIKDTQLPLFNEYWMLTPPNADANATLTLRWDGSAGSFEKNNVLLSRTDGDWKAEPEFVKYTGSPSAGTIQTVEHSVGGTRYYALSSGDKKKDGIWSGSNGTAWKDKNNWLYHEVPTSNTTVTINGGLTNYPVISTVAYMNTLGVKSGAKLTVASGSNANVGGAVDNQGTVDVTGGVVRFNSTMTNNNITNITGGQMITNALLENIGTMNITGGELDVQANVHNASAANFTLSGHGSTVKIEGGVLTNDGNFTIKYSYDASPNFYYVNDMVGAKKINIERTFSPQQLYYVGSATSERQINSGLTQDDYIYYFEEGRNVEHELTGSSLTVNPHTLHGSKADGDIMKSASVIGMTGVYENGDWNLNKDISINQVGTPSKAEVFNTSIPAMVVGQDLDYYGQPCGWTWLSQPYPFSVGINSISLNGGQVKSTIYVKGRLSGTRSMLGKFYTYNMSTGVCANSDNDDDGDIYTLAPFQSFCIRNYDTEAPMSVSIQPNMSIQAMTLKSLRRHDEPDVLRVFAETANGLSDEAVFVFRDGGLPFYTTGDSQKLTNDGGYPSISIIKEDGRDCAVAYYPPFGEIDEETTFPLAIKGNKNGLTLVISNIDGFDSSKDVYILDSRTGEMNDMRANPEYIVDSPETVNNGTLQLVFKDVSAESNPTDSPSQFVVPSIAISAIDNVAVIKVNEVYSEATVKIYNLIGQLVSTNVIRDATTTVGISTNGLYIVEVVNGNDRVSKKLLLKK